MVTDTVVITGLLASGNQFCLSRTATYGEITVTVVLLALLAGLGLLFLRKVIRGN